MECPLCLSTQSHAVRHRERNLVEYFHCDDCDLIYLDSFYHLSASEERSRYLSHENHLENDGYLNFLRPTVTKVKEIVGSGAGKKGLDYGSGPNPVLTQILAREGYEVETYDTYFAPKPLGAQKYDFIVSTEVFEHFKNPRRELAQIQKILSGPLVVLTQLHQGPFSFANWWYAKDPTHVSFYSEKTFEWISKNFELDLHLVYNKQK